MKNVVPMLYDVLVTCTIHFLNNAYVNGNRSQIIMNNICYIVK